MVKKNPLDDMSDDEILTHLEERRKRRKAEAKEKLEAAAVKLFGEDWQKETGLRIISTSDEAKKKYTLVPVYRDPKDHSLVWTNQGNPPKWLHAVLDGKFKNWREKGTGPAIREFLDKNGYRIEDQEKQTKGAKPKSGPERGSATINAG